MYHHFKVVVERMRIEEQVKALEEDDAENGLVAGCAYPTKNFLDTAPDQQQIDEAVDDLLNAYDANNQMEYVVQILLCTYTYAVLYITLIYIYISLLPTQLVSMNGCVFRRNSLLYEQATTVSTVSKGVDSDCGTLASR